eukprot:snap_masked-scaffold_3-processed-gene-21.53-mRNA-1 protein AED:0.23 eAED:0.23 QI:0/0/0/0.66/1/1/3/0/346
MKFQKDQKVGIKNTSKEELNGKEGIIQSFEEDKGRYHVYIPSLGSIMSLKPENLSAASSSPPNFQKILEEMKTKGALNFAKEKGKVASDEFNVFLGKNASFFGVETNQLAIGLAVIYLMLYFTYGFLRANINLLIIFSGLKMIFPVLKAKYRGDKMELLKSCAFALRDGTKRIISDYAKEIKILNRPHGLSETENTLALASFFLLVAFLFYPSAGSRGNQDFDVANFMSDYQNQNLEKSFEFYNLGFQDGQNGEKKGLDEFKVIFEAANIEEDSDDGFDSSQYLERESGSGGFGLSKIIPLFIGGRFVYTLGQTPDGWSKDLAWAQFQQMELWKKALLVFISLHKI